MRNLLQLLLLAWVIWLMFRLLKNPRRRPEGPAAGRKKIDSTVVDTKDDGKMNRDHQE